jgi:hypothetical protein
VTLATQGLAALPPPGLRVPLPAAETYWDTADMTEMTLSVVVDGAIGPLYLLCAAYDAVGCDAAVKGAL